MLYTRAKTGSVHYWCVKVVAAGEAAHIVREYGVRGGKATVNTKVITAAKSCATPYDQAVFEAQKDWRDKKGKKGYVADLGALPGAAGSGALAPQAAGRPEQPTATEAPARQAAAVDAPAQQAVAAVAGGVPLKFLPMLANKFAERGKYVVYPCVAQPKLDGIRYTARREAADRVVLRTRSDSECPCFDDIKAALLRLPQAEDVILDGEFYSRRVPFRTLNGYCNRKKRDGKHGFDVIPPDDLASIHYHLFDCYFVGDPACPFEERYAYLEKLLAANASPLLELVPNTPVGSAAEVGPLHDRFVAEGYEGIIIRNARAPYLPKDRSNDLLKFKSFQDAEFPIVGAESPANGKEEGCVVWQLQAPGGATFTCRPRDTYEARKQDWEAFRAHPERFVGRPYTVRYQETYENGVPRFPSGIAIRWDA